MDDAANRTRQGAYDGAVMGFRLAANGDAHLKGVGGGSAGAAHLSSCGVHARRHELRQRAARDARAL